MALQNVVKFHFVQTNLQTSQKTGSSRRHVDVVLILTFLCSILSFPNYGQKSEKMAQNRQNGFLCYVTVLSRKRQPPTSKDPIMGISGEALGQDPTDPYPLGNEAFIQDHLRNVTAAVANDLRKIAVLPDK